MYAACGLVNVRGILRHFPACFGAVATGSAQALQDPCGCAARIPLHSRQDVAQRAQAPMRSARGGTTAGHEGSGHAQMSAQKAIDLDAFAIMATSVSSGMLVAQCSQVFAHSIHASMQVLKLRLPLFLVFEFHADHEP